MRQRASSLRTPEQRLEEAVGLAQALDLDVRETILAQVRSVVPATLFGKGKVQELAAVCAARDADVLVVDDALTPVQQRNLETALKVKVIDRGAPLQAHLAAEQGEAAAWLYRHGRILSRTPDADGGMVLSVRLDAQALGQFESLFPDTLLDE